MRGGEILANAKINIGGTPWLVVIDHDDEIAKEFGSYVNPSRHEIIVPLYEESRIMHEIVNAAMIENASGDYFDPYETIMSAMDVVREKLGKPPKRENVELAIAYRCPNCSKVLSFHAKRPGIRICQNCGQPLDWSEE